MAVSHFSAVSSTFGTLSIPSGGADVTLTAQQAMDATVIDITLTASKSLVFPTCPAGKMVIIRNLTGATYTVTAKIGTSTGIVVAAAKNAILMSTGTDFVRLAADA